MKVISRVYRRVCNWFIPDVELALTFPFKINRTYFYGGSGWGNNMVEALRKLAI